MVKYGREFKYPVIDSKKTGKQIKMECKKQGFTVKDIQEFLQIGAAQSVYDWFRGKSLPALDNMLALSHLLGVPMEKLIVSKNIPDKQLIVIQSDKYGYEAASVYYRLMSVRAA